MEPSRLKDTGQDAERALLNAPPPQMPRHLHQHVRLRVERQIEASGVGPNLARIAVAAGITFATAGALAFGVVKAQGWLSRASENSSVPHVKAPFAPHVKPFPVPVPSAQDDDAEAPVKPARRRHRPETGSPPLALLDTPVVEPAPAAEPPPRAVANPRLSFQDLLLEGLAEEPPVSANDPPTVSAPKGPGRFLVKWEGHRNVSLDVVDMRSAETDGLARIVGTVNRTPLTMEIRRGLITGKIGGEVINLWLKGEEAATGSIAGYPVNFVVLPTQHGYLLRGDLPGHSARLEVRKGLLRWYPGCENVLALKGAGVYQGTCAQGQSASVVLPPGFRQLPPLARLVTLALVLTERDPVFKHSDPQLFNPVP